MGTQEEHHTLPLLKFYSEQNITYITGSTVGDRQSETTWIYRLMGNADICFVRLDFDHFVLAAPLMQITETVFDGNCGGNGDTFQVETETASDLEGVTADYYAGFNSLCGTMTGQ